MAKIIRKRKNWYKGLTATAISIAMVGAAYAVPAFAADEVDTTDENATVETKATKEQNGLIDGVISWNEKESMTSTEGDKTKVVTNGTVVDGLDEENNAIVTGTVEKTETSEDQVQPPVYDEENAVTETETTTNSDGSTTVTTTTTTPGTQETETTVEGEIDIDMKPVESPVEDDIKNEISDAVTDWTKLETGNIVGDKYEVMVGENNTITFTTTDSSTSTLAESEIVKLLGFKYNAEGVIVDKDGNEVTITGNTVTVNTTTSIDVTLKDGETVDNNTTGVFETNNTLTQLEEKEDGYYYNGERVSNVITDSDGNITEFVVDDVTYVLEYTTVEDLSPDRIRELLGDSYSVENNQIVDKDGFIVDTNGLVFQNVSVKKTENTTTESDISFELDETTGKYTCIYKDAEGTSNTVTIDAEKVVKNNGSYTFEQGGKTYTVTTVTITDIDELLNAEGSPYSEDKDGNIVKTLADGTTEIVDITNFTKTTTYVTVEETVKVENLNVDEQTPTITINTDREYSNLDAIYNDLANQLVNQLTGVSDDGNNSTILGQIVRDANDGTITSVKHGDGSETTFEYIDDGVKLTTTKNVTGLSDAQIETALEEVGYSKSENQYIDNNDNPVTIKTNVDGTISITTTVTINNSASTGSGSGSHSNGSSISGNQQIVWSDEALQFYIQLYGAIADNTTADHRAPSNYTGKITTTEIGSTIDDSLPNKYTSSWIYQGSLETEGVTADTVIRSYFDTNLTNNKESHGYAIKDAPTDEEVFNYLKEHHSNGTSVYYLAYDKEGLLTSAKVDLSSYEAFTEKYAVYWYVLKHEPSDGYHIDGCIVDKKNPVVDDRVTKYTIKVAPSSTTQKITATIDVQTSFEGSAVSYDSTYDLGSGSTYYGMLSYEPKFDDVVTTVKEINVKYTYKYSTFENVEPLVETVTTVIPADEEPDVDPEPTFTPDPTPDDEVIEDNDTPLAPAPDDTAEENLVEDIEDEDVPLVSAPDEGVVIEDEVAPLASTPQTGVKGSHAVVPAGILAAAMALLLKRKHRAE